MLAILNIGSLVTCQSRENDPLGRLQDAALVATDGRVTWCGPQTEMPPLAAAAVTIDAHGSAVLPGLIDCHTHLLHVGDRSHEFAQRARGATYLEIAAQGGGILATVDAVRRASEAELADAARPRLERALRRGVTTIEIKSGYGLTVDDELKMLRAVSGLDRSQPVEIVPTFLGAHTVPREHRGDTDAYVDLVTQHMLPAIADAGLARCCDVYLEQGAFTLAQTRTILVAARAHGFAIKLHTDQFNALGGCALAAELGAISADHLEASRNEDILALARADIVGVILPLCEVYLGRGGAAPARALVDAGVRVAVASDFNPGSANCEDLCIAATLAVTRCGLTVEEAILGMTRHAAAALGRDDLGHLQVGASCDLVVLDTPNPLRMIADMGANHIAQVVKSGQPISL